MTMSRSSVLLFKRTNANSLQPSVPFDVQHHTVNVNDIEAERESTGHVKNSRLTNLMAKRPNIYNSPGQGLALLAFSHLVHETKTRKRE